MISLDGFRCLYSQIPSRGLGIGRHKGENRRIEAAWIHVVYLCNYILLGIASSIQILNFENFTMASHNTMKHIYKYKYENLSDMSTRYGIPLKKYGTALRV